MIRFVAADFEKLQDFLANYAIEPDLGAKVREEQLKRIHKRMLAALQAWAVIEALAKNGRFNVDEVNVLPGSAEFSRLGEFFSDVVAGGFAGIHALYKPAFMALRSGIENFFRSLAGVLSAEAAATTSVHRLFELAGQQQVFNGAALAHSDLLKQQYAELCLYTHTAGPAQMFGTTAFLSFHKHDTARFRDLVRRLVLVTDGALAILIFAVPDIYRTCPHRARDLLDEVLPSPAKMYALGE